MNLAGNQLEKFGTWFFFLFLPTICFAQAPRVEDILEREARQQKIREEEQKGTIAVKEKMEASSNEVRTRHKERAILYHNENELPPQEKMLLTVADEWREKYAAFLNRPETGLIKLLAYKENKLAVNDVRTQSAFPNIPGSGTYYSFTKRHHIADEWSQLRLYENTFLAAYSEMKRTTVAASGGMSQSFAYTSGYAFALFTELGNIPLENVTLQLPALKYLLEYQPPKESGELTNQRKIVRTGVVKDNFKIQSGVPSKPETTYAMRAINYKKSDAIYIFRVIEKATDGSVLLLWQQLKNFPSVELKSTKVR